MVTEAASAAVRAVRAGVGAQQVLAAGGAARVLAWFPRACYVGTHAGVLVLTAPDVPDGPLYLTLEAPLPQVPVGDRASVWAAGLVVGAHRVEAGGATPWRGRLPAPAAMGRAAAAIMAAAETASRGSLLPTPARALAEERLAAGDLQGLQGTLAGLGPGLTPSGDDALGGALFLLRALEGPRSEAALARVAEGARTTTVSRAFLRWHARGQALAPVHDLLGAAARRDDAGARQAARALAAVGESSGSDFALGLLLALRVALGRPAVKPRPEPPRRSPGGAARSGAR